MPMLGDILAEARRSSGGFEAWLRVADEEMAERVAASAAGSGLSTTGFVRGAVADFCRLAAEEDWATLTSALRESEDPGTTCLMAMVHWRLTAPACREHDLPRHARDRGAADEQSP